MTVPAHEQKITRSYWVSYPDHPAREDDPHYKDFETFRKKTKDTAQCAMGLHRGDFSECSLDKPLELHHSHLEFSLQNGVDLKWLEKDYPGVSDPDSVGAWVESADNLTWLCERCHRGHGGVHVATASDYEAEKYVRNLIKEDLWLSLPRLSVLSSACAFTCGMSTTVTLPGPCGCCWGLSSKVSRTTRGHRRTTWYQDARTGTPAPVSAAAVIMMSMNAVTKKDVMPDVLPCLHHRRIPEGRNPCHRVVRGEPE